MFLYNIITKVLEQNEEKQGQSNHGQNRPDIQKKKSYNPSGMQNRQQRNISQTKADYREHHAVEDGRHQSVDGGSHQATHGGQHQARVGGSHQTVIGGEHQPIIGGSHQSVPGGTHQAVRGGSHQASKTGEHQAILNEHAKGKNMTRQQREFKGQLSKRLTKKGLVDSVIFSEVLGPPRAYKPYKRMR